MARLSVTTLVSLAPLPPFISLRLKILWRASPALKKLSLASKLAPFLGKFFQVNYEGKTFFEKKVLPLKLPFP
ncbi:MAG: hypothetical protein IKX40_03015, partial [Thermoguttaceae bacterium]|nr:hypothetical protein [Thermoguttaceae bacterium]